MIGITIVMGFISQFMEVITIVHPDPRMLNTPWTESFKWPQRCLNPLLHHSFPKWCVHHVRSLYIYILCIYLYVFQTIVSSEEKCEHKLRTKLQKNTKKVNNGKHIFCSLSCLFRHFFQYSIFETLLFWTLCWAVVFSDSLMQFHIVFTKHVSKKIIVIIVQNWNGEHTRTGCVSNSEPNYHIEPYRSK